MLEKDLLQRVLEMRQRGDGHGEETAVNRLLEHDPKSLRGNIAKAECRLRSGDEIMAAYFFRRAMRLSEYQSVPPEVSDEVEHARTSLIALQGRQNALNETRLVQRGLSAADRSPRFRQSLEIAAGQKKLYQQEPTAFAYPGLPNIQFYDREQFDWVERIESATPDIRAELMTLLGGGGGGDEFRPYIRKHVSSVPLGGNAALADSRDWSILDLCENGWLAPRVQQRCPRTWATVLSAPVPRVAGWGPTILFSMLKAGARIAPHNGMFNTRLICHLPLIVPEGCGFRVGNEVRQWEVGKLLIFDDTIEHEAWNESDEDRVVLIFDIWRPELSEQERRELTALFSD